MFSAKAREQIEKLLRYVAASGNAALVDKRSRTVVATDGEDNSTGLFEQLGTVDLRRNELEEVPGVVVGEVGASFLLVVKEDIQVECSALQARLEKACEMLSRKLDRGTALYAAQFRPWIAKD